MDENKNINPELENEAVEAAENIDAAEETVKKEKKSFFKNLKEKTAKRPKKIKNEAFLKRGSYSLAITAAVIVGAIVINILVGALNDRFVLEYDMSFNKDNSISEENIDFIKDIDEEVTVTVCALEDQYSSYMPEAASYYYSVVDNEGAGAGYYNQTIKLINKYNDYNKKIKIKFIDTQSSEFTDISSKYSGESIQYGDILVTSTRDGKEKHKILGYKDIYALYEDESYAMYGMTMNTLSGNNVETALTSAIAYVTSDKIKKAGLIMSHSKEDYTASYSKLLKDNNYETTIIDDTIVKTIPEDLDLIVIPCPTTDFIGSELDLISDFLDNDGKLGKGLIFVADASAPYLKNLYDFLDQWGIVVEDGILFETNENNYLQGDPTTLGSYAAGEDDILSGMQYCITGLNAPMYAGFENSGGITVTPLMATPEYTVAAPKGTGADWKGADKYEPKSYSTVLQAKYSAYDDNNKLMESFVTAFSSRHFLDSEYNEYSGVANKDLLLAVTERAAGVEDSEISFVSKQITNESFATEVTEGSANIMRLIFMIILPLLCIAAGVYIYIKRRNA